MAIHKLDTQVFVGQKAFISKGGKVLVLKDPNYTFYGQSGLDFPGGKFRWGNNLVEELKREVREETGLEIEVGRPFAVWTNKNVKMKNLHSTVLIGYLCVYKSGDVILSDEHNHFEWVDKNSYKKWEDHTDFFQALDKYFKITRDD